MSQWKTEIKQVDHKVTVVNIVYKTIRVTETQTKVFVEFRATLLASLNCYCGNKPPTNMWLLRPTSFWSFWQRPFCHWHNYRPSSPAEQWRLLLTYCVKDLLAIDLLFISFGWISWRNEERNNYYFASLFLRDVCVLLGLRNGQLLGRKISFRSKRKCTMKTVLVFMCKVVNNKLEIT